jgi:hypothetical protein
MKSLNENLREEFQLILKSDEISALIKENKLDHNIINKAFEKLLTNKYLNADDTSKGKTEFQNMIINSLKENI